MQQSDERVPLSLPKGKIDRTAPEQHKDSIYNFVKVLITYIFRCFPYI